MPEWIDPLLSVLPPAQRRLWPELSEFPRHFVLYGGTGLALRVGGRQSEDFDLFTSEPVNAHALAGSLACLTGAELIQAAPNTATCEDDSGAGPEEGLRRSGHADQVRHSARTSSRAARGLYPDFAPLVSLKALSYFGDGDLADLPEDTRELLLQSAASVRKIPSIPRRAVRLSG